MGFGIEFQTDAESQQLSVQIREIGSNKIFYQSPEKSSFIEALLGVTTIKMNRDHSRGLTKILRSVKRSKSSHNLRHRKLSP